MGVSVSVSVGVSIDVRECVGSYIRNCAVRSSGMCRVYIMCYHLSPSIVKLTTITSS